MFSVHTTPEESKYATIIGDFAFVLEETREVKVPLTLKREASVFKFLRFELRFSKALFS